MTHYPWSILSTDQSAATADAALTVTLDGDYSMEVSLTPESPVFYRLVNTLLM